MEKREKLTPINDHITLIDDNGEATCYLVCGAERALLIDTANGPLDLKSLCAKLTTLPVTVVNTHGHCDHIFGNIWFDEARLHPDDFRLHDEHYQFPEMQKAMRENNKRPAKLLPLNYGEVFDLGGLTLEVVPLRGHTQGSIGLLDRKDRILFSGDGVIPHIWMQLNESAPIATLKQTLETLKREHGDEFDFLLTGHGKGLVGAHTYIDGLIKGCDELLCGERANDMPYKYFAGECLAHPYSRSEGECIVFTEEKLK